MSKVFFSLFEQNQVARVLLSLELTIAVSFEEDGSRVTGDEIRRRFAICERLMRELRGDLGWSLPRVLDHLPEIINDVTWPRQGVRPNRLKLRLADGRIEDFIVVAVKRHSERHHHET